MAATKADAKAEPTGGGGGGSFTEERLSDKLDKLSSSAASIQSILF
jgi:regulator of Ty1 transposition protein 103